jgi:hypothetical protein
MKITSVTVEYGLTENLGDYNNVRPSVRITADVLEGEDPDDVFGELWERAEDEVKEGVNQALEAHGRPALYHEGPRFDAVRAGNNVFVIPSKHGLDREVESWLYWLRGEKGHRYEHALELAEVMADERGTVVVDCSDGGLSPVVAAFLAHRKQREEEQTERERQRQEQIAAFRDGERGRHPFDDDDYEPEEDDEDF